MNFNKYHISSLRYGGMKLTDTEMLPCYQGIGISYFDTPKEALDAYIKVCSISSLFHPQTEKGDSLCGPSTHKKLHLYAEYYYLPVYGKQVGDNTLLVYIDNKLYATLDRNTLSITREDIDLSLHDADKVKNAFIHAEDVLSRYHTSWQKRKERDAKLKEIDPLYKAS